MTRVLKITDTTESHGSCGKCPGVITPSINFNVYAEDIPVAVLGDIFKPHPGSCNHNTALNVAACSPNVFINGFNAGIEGGIITCGDITMLNPTNQTFTNVFINN